MLTKTKKSQSRRLALTLMLSLSAGLMACRDPLPCDDCDEADAAEAEAPGPCGGADLQTDNANCGSCGTECYIAFEGTEWEAGGCVNGECGPNWTTCLAPPVDGQITCAEVCEIYAVSGYSCVDEGCGGASALIVDSLTLSPACSPDVPAEPLTGPGSCNEPIVYKLEDGRERSVHCCCAPDN